MSLSGVLGNALSGLNASQAGLRTASNNVANVNTPGYARTTPNLQSRNVNGSAMGVEVTGITRVVDKFLQAASLRAISNAGAAEVRAGALDRLQSQFGGLDDAGSLFSRLNKGFSGLSQASVDPTLSVSRLSAAADLQSFFDEAERLSIEIRGQRLEVDAKINATLQRTNEILNELYELNANVQNLSSAGGDTSGAANRQSELLDELADYLDINAATQADGRVVVRTGDGVLLLDNFPVELQYQPAGTGAYSITYGRIYAQPPKGGAAQELDGHVMGGELRALLDLRDTDLPQVAEELSELASGVADALNKAHSNATTYPAPNQLIGRNTGLDINDLHNFTGQTTIAVTGNDGTLVRRIDVDFTAQTLSVNGGAATGIGNTVGTFASALSTALGADGTAGFNNGVFNITASNANNGIATLQDTTTPSDRGGRGFAHFFGLNNIIDSTRPGFFETGMTGAEWHGFAAGSSMTFRVEASNGSTAGTISIPMVAGQTFNDIINDLNNATTGLGRYATTSLDANGSLQITPNAGYEGFKIDLVSDTTQRSGSSMSFSDLFGVGLQARGGRAEIYEVNQAIRTNADRMSLAMLDVTAIGAATPTALGAIVLTSGDTRGGQALQAAQFNAQNFAAAGTLSASSSSLQDYSARFAGNVGARAARAESESGSAEVLMETAQQKRTNVEGVNLDEELAAMTLYQQSYNASARMLQAAKEMTDTLMNIV